MSELLELFDYCSNDFDEVTRILESAEQVTMRGINLWMCEVSRNRLTLNEGGGVCHSCGSLHGYLHENERPREDEWMKKKSVHQGNKSMEKNLREYGVHWSNNRQGFPPIVAEFRKHIANNVGRYDYYVMRVCSRRQIPTPDSIRDIKNGPTIKNKSGKGPPPRV